MRPLPAEDLDQVLSATSDLWGELRGAQLFLTGGTSFLGRWLVESFLYANARRGLGARLVMLTRHPTAFAGQAPHLVNDPALTLLGSDLENFPFPEPCSHILHAGRVEDADPLRYLNRNLAGTERVLEFARLSGAQRFVYTSSGSFYGPRPPEISHIPEDFSGAPDPLGPDAAKGMMKRACEFVSAQFARRYGLRLCIARCFTFLGPHLPLNIQLAAGNFIRDALAGGPIRVEGDGTPYRSYLYAADLAIWLWTLLLRGTPGRAYNVGSEQSVTIAELAHRVAAHWDPPLEVTIARAPQPGKPPESYVPATARARQELGLRETVPLDEALARTLRWYQGQSVADSREAD
ncbi:MAG: NAD(P)-dependent oxidoreductase [candidate division WS1 bacterium]|nr:NAD(P)-dependent oxidoreductase [candidate division WS1 bacterium]